MNSYVVVENRFHADLLRRLLPTGILDQVTEIMIGGSRSSTISLGKTLLYTRQAPVVVVLDAGTTSERAVREQRLVVGELLRYGAPPVPVHLALAEPEFAVILFHDVEALATILEIPISSEERIHARYRPREILDELLARSASVRSPEQLVDRIDTRTARRMADHTLVREIVAAIESEAAAEVVPAS